MNMFDDCIYFPILKSKQGELQALGHLTEAVKSRLVPVIDVVPNSSPNRTFGQHLDRICESLVHKWGHDSPFIFDLFDINPDQRTETNEHPVDHLFRSSRDFGIRAIPTCGLDRDPDYLSAIGRVLQEMEPHLLVRLQREDLQAPTISVPELQKMLAHLDLAPEQVTILIDFREIQAPIDVLTQQALTLIGSLRNIGNWNTHVIAGSAMPRSVASAVRQSSQGYISRLEQALWAEVNSSIDLPIGFGDYTVINPEYIDIDPRIYANTMGPSIRYTTAESWLVVRGSSFSSHPDGYRQYYALASTIDTGTDFMGKDFSYGDHYLSDRGSQYSGSGAPGPGNPGTWLSAGSNHHMTYVVNSMLVS